MFKYLIIGLFLSFFNTSHSQEDSEKMKITLEFLSEKENEQFVAIYETSGDSNENEIAISGAQGSKTITSGWKYIYYTTDLENPIIFKVGTWPGKKKRKITINLYVNDTLVKTKTEKAGSFLSKPVQIMYFFE